MMVVYLFLILIYPTADRPVLKIQLGSCGYPAGRLELPSWVSLATRLCNFSYPRG